MARSSLLQTRKEAVSKLPVATQRVDPTLGRVSSRLLGSSLGSLQGWFSDRLWLRDARPAHVSLKHRCGLPLLGLLASWVSFPHSGGPGRQSTPFIGCSYVSRCC